MNWNLVCNGGNSIGALAIGDLPQYQNITSQVMTNAMTGIPFGMKVYSPNGAWPEGTRSVVVVDTWCHCTSHAAKPHTHQLLGLRDTLLDSSIASIQHCHRDRQWSGSIPRLEQDSTVLCPELLHLP